MKKGNAYYCKGDVYHNDYQYFYKDKEWLVSFKLEIYHKCYPKDFYRVCYCGAKVPKAILLKIKLDQL